MSKTTKHHHAFQKLCYFGFTLDGPQLLLAAAGSQIFSFCLRSGDLLAQWPSKDDETGDSDLPENGEDGREDEPPSKKRKMTKSNESSTDSSESVEIVAERAKGQRRKAKVVNATLPKVSHLIATKDKKNVVAVTAEDKCIRVFELRKGARLKLLSERSDQLLLYLWTNVLLIETGVCPRDCVRSS